MTAPCPTLAVPVNQSLVVTLHDTRYACNNTGHTRLAWDRSTDVAFHVVHVESFAPPSKGLYSP